MYFYWLLKTKNWKQHFACFQFPSQIEFWEQFLFSIHFGLPNKFFSLKNRKLFLEIENKKKKQLPNIPLIFWHHKNHFIYFKFFFFGLNIYFKLSFHHSLHVNWFYFRIKVKRYSLIYYFFSLFFFVSSPSLQPATTITAASSSTKKTNKK